jgi:uncharacterized alpha/beta hydrolase family protein
MNTWNRKNKVIILLLVLLLVLVLISISGTTSRSKYESLNSFKEKDSRIFPFRYFTDSNDNVVPYIAVTGFFRDSNAKEQIRRN